DRRPDSPVTTGASRRRRITAAALVVLALVAVAMALAITSPFSGSKHTPRPNKTTVQPPPPPSTSPAVDLVPVKWWAGWPDQGLPDQCDSAQLKVKPRTINHTPHSASVAVTDNGPIFLAI